MQEMYDVLKQIYEIGSQVPRPILMGTVGAVGGFVYGVVKGKDPKTCLKYGSLGAFIIAGGDAFLEVWDKESLDIQNIVEGLKKGYTTNSSTQTLDIVINGDETIKTTEHVIEKIPFDFKKAVSEEFIRLAKYSKQGFIDTFYGGISGTIENFLFFIPYNYLKKNK